MQAAGIYSSYIRLQILRRGGAGIYSCYIHLQILRTVVLPPPLRYRSSSHAAPPVISSLFFRDRRCLALSFSLSLLFGHLGLLWAVTRKRKMGKARAVPSQAKDGKGRAWPAAGGATPTPTLNGLVAGFAAKGPTSGDLAAMSGAHTVGMKRCQARTRWRWRAASFRQAAASNVSRLGHALMRGSSST